MMSLETIRDLSEKAARRAAREHRVPYVPEPGEDVPTNAIPFLGDYVPRGYRKVARAELAVPAGLSIEYTGAYGHENVMVDSSGFGSPGEPALTVAEFLALMAANPGIGWAVVEAGQFQVIVGAYRRTPKAKTRTLPLTGTPCHCRRGIERDNCPDCEGTGRAIDWRAFHAARGGAR